MTSPKAHALLSASGSDRWIHCPPSARATEHFKDESSPYAKEGTLAHELAERLIKAELGEKIKPLIKKITGSPYYYEGMAEDLDDYVRYVTEKYREAGEGASIDLEQRLDFSKYVPDGFGTGDCIIMAGGNLEVIDLKFGRGVEVSAKENSQLMLYGIGAYLAYDFIYDIETVTMTIVQPRLNAISSYTMKVSELIVWAEEVVKPRAELAYNGEGDYLAGDWCRWCKLRETCRTRAFQAIDVFKTYSEADPLTNDEIGIILLFHDQITGWLSDLKERATKEILSGNDVPGWKLVEGRSTRKIKDQDAMAKALKTAGYKDEDIYKPLSINNITTLEKLVGKKRFGEEFGNYLEKPKGAPTLAQLDDKRREYSTVEDEFEFEN